jgi:hypothetical protein
LKLWNKIRKPLRQQRGFLIATLCAREHRTKYGNPAELMFSTSTYYAFEVAFSGPWKAIIGSS